MTSPPSPLILYLDDDEYVGLLVAEVLGLQNMKVVVSASPSHALELLHSDPTAYSLFVTDYNMPGTTGIEVALQARQALPTLTIALASSLFSDEMRGDAQAAGIDNLIRKGFDIKAYCQAISELAVPGPH